jgi:hypothetical protein
MTEQGNSISRCKECVSGFCGFRREVSRREHQINSHTQGEISRWLRALEGNTVWEETQLIVTEHSEILW